MDNIVKRKAYLITRYLKGSLTGPELRELEEWIAESDENRRLFESLTDPVHLRAALDRYDEKKQQMLDKIRASMAIDKISQWGWRYTWGRCIAVAVVVGLLFVTTWYLLNKNTLRYTVTNLPDRFRNEIAPGADQGRLTLDDSSVIILIDTVNGLLATDASGRTQVFKENGWLSYHNSDPGDSLYYNILRVPRKGQYKVLLPDGSRAWLNAGSMLRYPVTFGRQERRVQLEGEACFEVTSLPHANTAGNNTPPYSFAPFIVDLFTASGKTSLHTPGARFNVKNYTDESHIDVTLLEGALKIHKGPNELTLKPTQQGLLYHSGQIFVLNDVNTTAVIDWKEGMFRFRDAGIEQIMKEVERWYDVEVLYEGSARHVYTGSIERNTPLSQLLKYLEELGPARFKIDSNRVTVLR